jgi:hypothetical protein
LHGSGFPCQYIFSSILLGQHNHYKKASLLLVPSTCVVVFVAAKQSINTFAGISEGKVSHRFLVTALERNENTLKGLEDFHLKAKARHWP